jgi:hypothetical protein
MQKINRTPSRKDLLWFGGLLGAFALILGAILSARAGMVWGLGVGGALLAIDVLFWAAPPLRRSIYVIWMTIVFPIGFVISHAALAVVYYGVVTPFGLALRLFGRDSMGRRFEPGAGSYWIEHHPDAHPERYFRQY